MGRKSRLSVIGLTLVVVVGLIVFAKYSGVIEAFECWCRDSSSGAAGTVPAVGNVTAQLQRFTQIVSNSKWMVGVEAGTDKLFYSPLPLTPNSVWKSANGSLEYISISDQYLLGTNRDGTIYATDVSSGLESAYSNPAWYNIPGSLFRTAILGNTFYGINGAGNFYSCAPGAAGTQTCKSGNWTSFPGAGMSIAADPVKNVIITRGTDNNTYTCPSNCSSSVQWVKQ